MKAHVSTKHRRIVLPYAGRCKALAPRQSVFTIDGHGQFVQLEYTPQVYDTLRNLGVHARNPIHYFYDFPIQHGRKPFKQQFRAADLLTVNKRAYLLSDLGSGKTLAVLWAFDWLKRHGLANRLLVAAPLSTLRLTWEAEAFETMPGYSVGVLYGTAQKRRKVLAEDHDVYIINHDGVKVLFDDLLERPDIDCVALDELSVYKDRRTSRWKLMNKLLNGRRKVERVWGLTGTPTPNGPTDAYAQCRLVTPWTVPATFARFEDMTTTKITEFKRLPKPGAAEAVKAAMAPAIRAGRGMDLPPTTYSYRAVELTSEQQKHYRAMMKDFRTEALSGEITAANEGVKLSKLLQIGCGFGYGEGGTPLRLPGGEHRSKIVREVVDQATGKVIVFSPFTEGIKIIAEGMADLLMRDELGIITGATGDRHDVLQRFQNGSQLRVLVAHPRTMSHGLTLTAADTIVWASPYPSLETYLQANGRIVRPGQKRNTHIIMLVGSKTENAIYRRLKVNESLQGTLLKLIEEEEPM